MPRVTEEKTELVIYVTSYSMKENVKCRRLVDIVAATN